MLTRGLTLGRGPNQLIHAISKRYLAPTSQKPRPEKKHYRLWAIPGDLVYQKDILAKQFTMLWHPGLNAGIDSQRNIYALCDGVMIITEEKYEPDWDYELVKEVYNENLAPPYKRYIHVIPKKGVSEFKLVDVV